jgi:hypothetical protein
MHTQAHSSFSIKLKPKILAQSSSKTQPPAGARPLSLILPNLHLKYITATNTTRQMHLPARTTNPSLTALPLRARANVHVPFADSKIRHDTTLIYVLNDLKRHITILQIYSMSFLSLIE